ncbi:9286_t:CDS:2, partial [Funneliformis caledonium]
EKEKQSFEAAKKKRSRKLSPRRKHVNFETQKNLLEFKINTEISTKALDRHRVSEAKTALRYNEQDLNDRMEEIMGLERS